MIFAFGFLHAIFAFGVLHAIFAFWFTQCNFSSGLLPAIFELTGQVVSPLLFMCHYRHSDIIGDQSNHPG